MTGESEALFVQAVNGPRVRAADVAAGRASTGSAHVDAIVRVMAEDFERFAAKAFNDAMEKP